MSMEMDLSSFCCFFIFLFLFVIHQPSNCQQDYLNNTQLNCGVNPSISKGYLCNGNDQVPCQSYITFLSLPPYDTPISIAYVLGSEASDIALINNISIKDKIPSQKLIVVPISCSCTGSIYQHNTPYTIKNLTESYFTIANNTYQGLTTCQALTGQNYYDPEHLQVGMELMVPLRCACPSRNQTADGVISLLMYMVTWGDTLSSIGQAFGADAASILEANRLSQNSIIFPFTPILVPLRRERCMADPENFFCQCPKGGVGGLNCRQDSKKFPTKLIILLGTGIGMGLLCLFLFSYKLFHFLKERRNRIRKERLFEQNGGFLLQQKLSSCGGGKKAKLFTAEELQRATDNYNQSRFLGQGGYGTVFKGMLPDGSIVAVKRSKTIDRTQIAQFINEVVILSQINHRNIVKLLGCCLETELPLLVYEFIPNGNLSNHIHEQDQESSFPWELRLRIASEVAGAVAYMHSSASSPIFHRDIKSSNILLDDKYSAKVSDFGTSRAIPFDRTHLTTAVQGTFGYFDPEYFHTSQFTEKSDVYSFGVVMIELITGEKPISFDRNEDERSLVAHFISSMKEDRLLQILDPRVAREARREDMHAIAKLATSCVRLNGKKRPTMREVAMELDGLRKSERCLQIDQELSLLRDDPSFAHRADEPGQESTEDYITFSLEMESTSF
ncbi:wall-associated receptor kinase-like 1 [Ricinus communis]|uniref:wall-associated receptor kinase-like 1 n=1 Tax=Ricinus communis TaxID=3988 RepID=UPI000D68C9F9|nr:wall-associated receptor kinase-like 1 [Ricinus communis]|eukprot:XP_015572172.2 wall-associated receptor kinase-like 1 [Ricinus communis]